MNLSRMNKALSSCLIFLAMGAMCARVLAETAVIPLPAAVLSEVRVPGTTAMGAAAINLASFRYTEREFYASGKANRYRGALPDAVSTAERIDGNWPYKTRVLVRAPDPSRFNGTLVVEWANVTAGQDVDFAFAEGYEYLLREGYAVAVVSVQKIGVDRLKSWSPARYGELSVDAPNLDPRGSGKVDEASNNPAGDPLSWDILAQVAKALKINASPAKPFPMLKVKRVIALGESQSGSRLTVYYNAIQPLHKFFDGFVHFDLARQRRADLKVPSISVTSEATAPLFPAYTTSRFTRTWAVPGASHSSMNAINYVDNMVLRDKSLGGKSFTQLIESLNCDRSPPFSPVNHGLVLNAALDAVDAWIRTGKEAAPSREIQRDATGAVVRDANGMAQGGVQIAQFMVPTAFIAPNGPSQFCKLSGHHRNYTTEELKLRYGTHDNYVTQVRGVMRQARLDGYILPYDEQGANTAAELSSVAR